MTSNQYPTRNDRAEAASKAINQTIRMIEEALDLEFPRGLTPSQSRHFMIECLREIL